MQPGSSKQGQKIEADTSKRKYQSLKDEDETEQEFESKKAKMHSLDSDEEDELETEKEKYNVAEVESRMFDGQEKATIDFDGDIKITAFNMEEEMQEGHFDKQGTFIFKKDKELVKDSWLDNIDWVKVKEREDKKDDAPKGLADSDSEDDDTSNIDIKLIYSRMVEVMNPGENVLKCIKRLGGQPGKNKRDKKKLDSEQQKTLDKMVGYANDILSTGDMDVYQKTYEQLKLVLAPKKDTDLDMFGDDLPAKSGPSTSKPSEDPLDVTKVMWEYRWEDKDGAEVFGPYSSEDMLGWTQEGYFGSGVFVRKLKEDNFHSSKRIDFDLYV